MTGLSDIGDNVFWETFWNSKAEEETDFQATGRGGMDVPGFLYTIREVVRILELCPEDELVDIGCGTGIVTLCLSPWLKRIHGVDISQNMVARARSNTSDADNVTIARGSIAATGEPDNSCDKVLAYSVLQYLPVVDDVEVAFQEIARILRPGGRALIAANPDPERREALQQAIEAKADGNMRQNEQKLIEHTGWHAPESLFSAAMKAGLKGRVHAIHPRIWQHFYMFDLVVKKDES